MMLSSFTGGKIKKDSACFFPALALSLFILSGTAHAAVLSTEPVEKLSSSSASTASKAEPAKLVSLEGDVKILKKGSENWLIAEKNQNVDVGDQILTGKNSSADIAYDNYLLNISHLKENTKAEIRSLNPTDIYLEDGSIFSALDGLSGEGGYQIATPTAVAAVRGTHFDVGFDKASQKFTAASLPTGDEGHVSKIFVSDPQDPDSEGVEVVENKQLDLKSGDLIRKDLVKPADPIRLAAGKAVFAQMGQRLPQFQELRGQGKTHLQEMRQNALQEKAPAHADKKEEGRGPKPPFKGKQENLKNSGQPPETAPEETGKPAADPLENVRAFDAMLEEDKPQQAKPFGSFKPQPKSSLDGSTAQAGENQNAGQDQNSGTVKQFGMYRPQSINSGTKNGFGPQGGMKPENAGFQQANGPQQNNPQPQQGRRPQGPPPQGPPKR